MQWLSFEGPWLNSQRCQHDVLLAGTAGFQTGLSPPPLFFFLVVLCFDRPLLSSLCLLMSTVEPTAEGTTQPERNKETTRSITDCLQWAIGEGIGQYLCCTNTQGEGQNGKLCCTLCAVWLSSKGAILKHHVLGKNKKQPDGSYARQPGTHARKAALQSAPALEPEQWQQLSQPRTIIVNVPQQQLSEPSSSTTSSPTNKQKPKSGASVLEAMLEKGGALQESQMDITRTFSATNIPPEKLGHPEMKEFFAKYLAQYPLVHPNNYCGTWLPKAGSDQRVRIERIFRKRERRLECWGTLFCYQVHYPGTSVPGRQPRWGTHYLLPGTLSGYPDDSDV